MLFLFNKAKIISYTITVFTVLALFFVADNLNIKEDSIFVTANVVNKSEK